ncbi:hypothetical protein REPUB_Repub01dG0186300 [Reevesia pubescens]
MGWSTVAGVVTVPLVGGGKALGGSFMHAWWLGEGKWVSSGGLGVVVMPRGEREVVARGWQLVVLGSRDEGRKVWGERFSSGLCVRGVTPSFQARCTLVSTAANSVQSTSDGYEESNRAIDFNRLFESCNQLHLAKRLHALVVVSGKAKSIFISSRLVNIYAYLGDVSFSRRTFNQIPIKDVYTWNSMVSAYVRSEALDVLNEMRLEGVMMDPVTIVSILPICAQLDDNLNGMLIHLYAIKHGLEFDLFVSNALIYMYAKFGKLEHAQKVFDHMVVRDVVSWNSIIAAYEQNDDPNRALRLFYNMQLIGTSSYYLTLVSLSSIVAQLSDSRSCKSIHGFVMRRGWILKDFISVNSMVDMYAKLGVMDSARAVFEALPVKDVLSWNALLRMVWQVRQLKHMA